MLTYAGSRDHCWWVDSVNWMECETATMLLPLLYDGGLTAHYKGLCADCQQVSGNFIKPRTASYASFFRFTDPGTTVGASSFGSDLVPDASLCLRLVQCYSIACTGIDSLLRQGSQTKRIRVRRRCSRCGVQDIFVP